ncbi:hypothetical protein SOVF_129400 [Spinacia oleracea]|nr:hypothetical protein SOVF_129400 [Spinacia oleracea]
MSGNNNETSWADQWDLQPAYGGGHDYNDNKAKKKGGDNGSGGGAKKKVEEGLAKTKDVASTGFKKVKQGTSFGFNWIKDKCQKTTQKE